MTDPTADEMLRALVRQLAALDVGEYGYTLDTEGDRTIELSIRISRRLTPAEHKRLLEEALAHLGALEYWRGTCGALKTSGPARQRRERCSNDFTHVAVYPGYFRFYCPVHADKPRTDRNATAVIELPRLALASVMAEVKHRANLARGPLSPKSDRELDVNFPEDGNE